MAKRKNKKVTANRNYKDTVFRKLFSDRRNLLSLYNAINGTAYTDEMKLEIVTLENAIYMGMKNDLAFIIDTNLFLYEQSQYAIEGFVLYIQRISEISGQEIPVFIHIAEITGTEFYCIL